MLQKEKKKEKTTKLIHVGRLDKVTHFIPKEEEKKSLAFSQILYISSVFFQVCLWVSHHKPSWEKQIREWGQRISLGTKEWEDKRMQRLGRSFPVHPAPPDKDTSDSADAAGDAPLCLLGVAGVWERNDKEHNE